jgi:non-specific serine/threonine protein kinase
MHRGSTFLLVLAVVGCTSEADVAAPGVAGLEWRLLEPMPTVRTEVAAAAVDGRIVVVGGFAPGATVPTVEVYDLAADTWTAGPDLPVAVNHAMAASLEDEAYVFGGTDGDGAISDAAFVLRGEAWEALPPMPEPRTAGGAAVAGGLIYVVGGVGPEGVAERTLVFDPAAGRWSVTEGLGRPREHMGVAAFDDRVYAVGGRAGTLAGFGDVEVLDPGRSWSRLPDLPTARGGMAATATSNGFVVAAGGEQEGGTFDEVEAFDVEAQRWVALPPMPTARHGLGVVAVGTTVYVLAGGVDPGLSFSGAVESIDLAALG